jgi:hypothetical protein
MIKATTPTMDDDPMVLRAITRDEVARVRGNGHLPASSTDIWR